jgi:transmembrane sensor
MTPPTVDPQNPSYQLGLQASEWLVRLQEPQTDPKDPDFDPKKRNKAFLAWLIRSPQHLTMFLDTYEVYERLGNIDPSGLIDIQALLRQATPARHPAAQDSSRRRLGQYLPRTKTVRWAAAAAIAALTLSLVGGWPRVPFKSASATSVSYFTAVGERRTVRLEDGSDLTLNTASRVEVTLDRDTRQVRLISGEVLFNVHHDDARPFLVESDDVRIFDLGTQFDVYKGNNGLRVSVIEGRVHLTCACSGFPSRPTTVSANSIEANLGQGDQANIAIASGTSTLNRRKRTMEELDRALAWKDGHLAFSGEPLSEVIQEFNRYNAKQFVIVDPDIAKLRLAGFFPSADPDKLFEALHRQWGIQALAPSPNDPNTIRLVGKPQ